MGRDQHRKEVIVNISIRRPKNTQWVILLIITAFLSSCSYNQQHETIIERIVLQELRIPFETRFVTEPQIFDVTNFSQEPLYYADSDTLLLPTKDLQEFHESYHKRFFLVWTQNLDHKSKRVLETKAYYQNQLTNLIKNPGIGENKLKRDTLFALNLAKTANIEGEFNTMRKGIITNYTNVRVLPTIKPFYLNFLLAGEGYPFDYWQNSTIPIGTPIIIYHETENWALIDSHICSGWVPRNYFTYIDEDSITQMMRSEQIAITKDKIPLFSTTNEYIGHADIGTVFSILHEKDDHYEVIFFNRLSNNMLPLVISKNISQKIPIPLTSKNIASIASEMMKQEYGWGGLYFNRDCSQSLLDIYIGFGILLPRNGRQQAYDFGRFHDMKGIKNNSEKKQEIIDKATPFLTLVRTPGHIMLYIGSEDGEPLVFHTVWGVRTIDQNELEGRHILGSTVITTLEPGKELPHADPDMSLINRLEGITFFK